MKPNWIERFFRNFRGKKSEHERSSQSGITNTVQGESAKTPSSSCFSDSPLVEPTEDRFGRWPFAQRIAETVASQSDAGSTVIAIYGSWGEGKTTVINFIERALSKNEQIVWLKFNPWRWSDEPTLLRAFFDSLADAMGKSILSRKEKIGDLIRQYGAFVSPVSVAGISGAAVSGIGEKMAAVTLERLKKRIDSLLSTAKKRLVVAMDDIDRLDKQEIRSVFRLVKLTADFPFTTFLLAFDDEMVASAISEQYSGSKDPADAGERFLEKIVQVPLTLPPCDTSALRKYCFDSVDSVLSQQGMSISEAEAQEFVVFFSSGLEIRLTTPRMARRYANTLAFAIPLLKGEVNLVDQMLVEGLGVFFPEIYRVVRDNPDVVLGEEFSRSGGEGAKERARGILEVVLKNLSADERRAMEKILQRLFPRLGSVFGGGEYASEWNDVWAKEKRAASKEYFKRYFRRAVAVEDISDRKVEAFLDILATSPVKESTQSLRALLEKSDPAIVVEKLRRREKGFSAEQAEGLVLALGGIADILPNPEGEFPGLSPFSQATMMASRLIGRIADQDKRSKTAIELARTSVPVSFAFECNRWIQVGEASDRILDEAALRSMQSEICTRVEREIRENRLFGLPERAVNLYLWIWREWGDASRCREYVAELLRCDPHNAVKLLSAYAPIATEMTGVRRKAAMLRRDEYESITKLIPGEEMLSYLTRLYGDQLKDPQYDTPSALPLGLQLAHQFAHIHHELTQAKGESPERA